MSPETASQLWDRVLAPKILKGTLFVTWQIARLSVDLGYPSSAPWLWLGSKRTRLGRKTLHAPEGLLRAPGPHLYPAPKGNQIPAARLVYHLLIGPTDNAILRYHGPLLDQPNVCPEFYTLMPTQSVGRYEPPVLESRTEFDDLIILIEGGGDPTLDYTPDEIQEARDAINSR